MAYRIEKEPNGVQAIIIDGFDKGISPDPYSGLNMMSQVNLSVPGEVSAGYPVTSSTISSGTVGNPIHHATQYSKGSATFNYILTSISGAESLVFKSSNGTPSASWAQLSTSNTNTSGTVDNQGLAFWKGYLFKFRDGRIDYLANGTGTWVSNWKPSDGTSGYGSDVTIPGVSHFALVSQDDALYFCNGSGIGSILEVAGATFDPTNIATYTYAFGTSSSANALQIPFYDTAQCLAEQGTNLLVGGSLNAIYPWDRLSTSFTYPIFIADSFIKRMVTANTNVFIFPGSLTGRGRIYLSNGSNANLYFKIPDYLFGENDPYYIWGDAMWYRNQLIFGFLVKKNGGSGNISSDEIWAINLETKSFSSISRAIVSSDGVGYPTVLIPDNSNAATPGMAFTYGAMDVTNNNALIGYSGTTSGVGSYRFTTDKIPVGSLLEKKTYSQMEFKLRTDLASGEGLVITYVTDIDSGTVGSTDFATAGAVISDLYTVSFEKAQWVQFQFLATGNSATSGVRLKELRLR